MRNEVKLQTQARASEQSEVSYWDDGVQELYGKEFDAEFVEFDLIEWFWEDLDVPHVAVIDEQGAPVLSIFEGDVMAPSDAQFLIDENADLIEQATQNYFSLRKARGDGFATFGEPVYADKPLYASDFRIVEGVLGQLVVQAIVPDFEAAIADGNPRLLMTFFPFGEELFEAISVQLGLGNLMIQPTALAPAGAAVLPVGGTPETPIAATWTVSTPAQTIWDQVLPVFLAILGAIALGLGSIAVLYGRAAHKVQKKVKQKIAFWLNMTP